MFKVDVLKAVDNLCARWNCSRRNAGWPVDGKWGMFNSQRLPPKADRAVHNLVGAWERSPLKMTVRRVDVSNAEVWTIQRNITYKTMRYLLRKEFAWQNWPRWRLPIFVLWQDRTIIWNGTHRSLICRLAGRKCRGRVIDMNEFSKWRKSHPTDWEAKPRIIVVKPRKKTKKKARRRG